MGFAEGIIPYCSGTAVCPSSSELLGGSPDIERVQFGSGTTSDTRGIREVVDVLALWTFVVVNVFDHLGWVLSRGPIGERGSSVSFLLAVKADRPGASSFSLGIKLTVRVRYCVTSPLQVPGVLPWWVTIVV